MPHSHSIISRCAAYNFVQRVNYKCRNTHVVDGCMYLYGNKIAWWEAGDVGHDLKLCMCGWPTTTTRARLNAILRELDLRMFICQRASTQYMTGEFMETELDPTDTFTIPGDQIDLLKMMEMILRES